MCELPVGRRPKCSLSLPVSFPRLFLSSFLLSLFPSSLLPPHLDQLAHTLVLINITPLLVERNLEIGVGFEPFLFPFIDLARVTSFGLMKISM